MTSFRRRATALAALPLCGGVSLALVAGCSSESGEPTVTTDTVQESEPPIDSSVPAEGTGDEAWDFVGTYEGDNLCAYLVTNDGTYGMLTETGDGLWSRFDEGLVAVDGTEATAEYGDTIRVRGTVADDLLIDAATQMCFDAAAGMLMVTEASPGSVAVPPVDFSEVSGELNLSGSQSVEALSTVVAESLAAIAPGISMNIDAPGTEAGFELLCGGDIDIANADRPISPEEVVSCASNSIEFVELEIGLNGGKSLYIYVNARSAAANPAVAAFVDHYLSDGILTVGITEVNASAARADLALVLTELPDDRLDATRVVWDSRTIGTTANG